MCCDVCAKSCKCGQLGCMCCDVCAKSCKCGQLGCMCCDVCAKSCKCGQLGCMCCDVCAKSCKCGQCSDKLGTCFYYGCFIIATSLSLLMFDTLCDDEYKGCKSIENRSTIQLFRFSSSNVQIKFFLR